MWPLKIRAAGILQPLITHGAVFLQSLIRNAKENQNPLITHATEFLSPLISLAAEILRPLKITRVAEFPAAFTTVFVDTRLSKRKHPRKRFQNFRQSCVLSRSEGHTSGCDWWISIRSVDNMHDWRKFWKRFRGCFVFESRVSTKTVVITRPAEIPQLLITDGAEILQPLIDSCCRMSAEFLSYHRLWVSIKISKSSCLI